MPNTTGKTHTTTYRLPNDCWEFARQRAGRGRKFKKVNAVIRAVTIAALRHDMGRKR